MTPQDFNLRETSLESGYDPLNLNLPQSLISELLSLYHLILAFRTINLIRSDTRKVAQSQYGVLDTK